MAKLTIAAPAKVNLHLRVKARRPDGFHDLESVFVALAFGDTLYFETLNEDNALEIEMAGDCALPGLPTEQNIVFKAISGFRNQTGYVQGLRVRVEKRIPPGGGLGGGSSDAASTLLALNSLAGGRSLDGPSLAALAASLGSDVPFFLTETGAALVRGRGELIQTLPPPEGLFLVLVNPGFPSETAGAFRLLDEYRAAGGPAPDGGEKPDLGPLEAAVSRILTNSPRHWPFTNDFLPVFLHDFGQKPYKVSEAKAYRSIIGGLRDLGADFAGLSGAGSTCFGVFAQQERAQEAEKVLSGRWNFAKFSFLLAHRAIAVLE
jgi:4-diphosphocytidyl-2-C-methyl-D-erythritol kinase